jgi:cytochrome c556
MKDSLSLPRVALAAAALTLLAAPVSADAPKGPPSKAKRTIEYRQSVMTLIGWNIGPIAAMVKGQIPFDAKAAEVHATRLAELAPMIDEGFPPDSQTGAPTKAKAEIWQNMDDFRSKTTHLEQATTQLAQMAASGDRQQVAKGLGEVGNACKACHDKYRAK